MRSDWLELFFQVIVFIPSVCDIARSSAFIPP